MAGVRLAAGEVLPAGPATVLAIAAAILVTGALHEDGLADTADALGAHTTRERRLEILRDSRVGTFGALAVGLALLFSFSILAPLGVADLARAAVVAHVLARWSILPQTLLVPGARPGGAGALVRAGGPVTVAATAYSAAIALAVGRPVGGAVALAVAVAITALGGLVARRTLGGITGDTLGATAKITELATYAALVAAW
jgi:adenosylcobinamide-GDP ribazoletransferase